MLHPFDDNPNHISSCVQAPKMGLKLKPRAPESMQMLNPRGHHTYKKSESRIFKGFKIVLHNLNQIENMRSGLFLDRKMNPRASESMQISNPHGHHIYKKSEECILKVFKIVLHTSDSYQNQIEIMR